MAIESKNRLNGKIRSVIFSKDTPIFLFFLLLATIFWFIQSLDKQRTTTLEIPIQYFGIPEDIELEEELPAQLNVLIRDEGMSILNYRKKTIVPLALDIQHRYSEKGRISVSGDQLKYRLSQYVFPSTAILNISPDSIASNYYKLSSKTVPILLVGDIPLAKQYVLKNKLEIQPDRVKVYGPGNIIDTISAIYTEQYKGKTVSSDSTFIQLNLTKPSENVKLDFNDVNVGVFIEMFTENKVEIPITIKNVPQGTKVRLFPSTVTVTYNVKMSDFSKMLPTDVQVVFDYKEAVELQKREYTLQTDVKTDKVWSVRVAPKRVEFLFEKD